MAAPPPSAVFASTTDSTPCAPETNVCAEKSPTSRASELDCRIAFIPSAASASMPFAPASADGRLTSSCTRIRKMKSADTARQAPAAAKPQAVPAAATIRPPSAGPRNQLALSIAEAATFAAVSSSGVFASVGRSAESAGRNAEPATAKRTTNAITIGGGPPAASTAAAISRLAARVLSATSSTRRRGKRSATTPAKGEASAVPARRRPGDDADGDGAAVLVGVERDDDPVGPAADRACGPCDLQAAQVWAPQDGRDRVQGAAPRSVAVLTERSRCSQSGDPNQARRRACAAARFPPCRRLPRRYY